MKILDLVLKGKWYDLIENGDKREEYRVIKPYWTKRLKNEDGTFKDFTHVKFRYGYTKRSMMFEIIEIRQGRGKKEWGAEDIEYYVISFK